MSIALIVEDIERIKEVEEKAWGILANERSKEEDIQEALFQVQWCIQRRNAALQSMSQLQQVALQKRAVVQHSLGAR